MSHLQPDHFYKGDALQRFRNWARAIRPIAVGRYLLTSALYLTAFTLLDQLTVGFQTQPGITIWYPPNGITLAVLWAFGLRYAPIYFLAELISNFWTYNVPVDPVTLVIWSLFITLCYSGVAAWLRHRLRLDPRLGTMWDVNRFVLVAGLASVALAGLVVISFAPPGPHPLDAYFGPFFQWWIGEAIGLFTVTPFVLVIVVPALPRLLTWRAWRLSRPQIITLLAEAATILISLWVIFSSGLKLELGLYYLAFIPLVGITLRHGLRGAVTAILAINFGATFLSHLNQAGIETQMALQVFMLTLSLTGLALGAVVTQRGATEIKLQRNEARYRTLFESNPHPMLVYDIETLEFLAVNDAATRNYGYSHDEFTRLTVIDIRLEEDIPALLKRFSAGQSEFDSYVARHRKKDGTIIDVEISSHTVMWDARRARLVLAMDVSERRRAEEIVRANEHRFRTLLENSTDAITLFDINGIAIYDTPAAPSMLGYADDGLIGSSLFDAVHPEDKPEVKRQFGQVLTAPSSQAAGVFRVQHRDGSWRWLEGVGRNLLNEPGVEAIVLNYRDVTERHEAEIQIRRNAERAEVMARTASRLNAQLNWQNVVTIVCEETAQALGVPLAYITLRNEGHGTSHYAGGVGLPDGVEPNEAEGPSSAALLAHGLRLVIHIPMLHQEKPIGELSIGLLGDLSDLDDDDLSLAQALADLAAQAFVNAQLDEDNLRQLERLTALNATAQLMTQTQGFEELASQIVETCVEAFDVSVAWLSQVLPDGRVERLAVYGQGAEFLESMPVRLDNTQAPLAMLGQNFASRFPIAIDDLADERSAPFPWRLAAMEAGFKSALLLPLLVRDEQFGAMLLFSNRLEFFTIERETFFKTYANQVGPALENARLFAETTRRLQTLRSLRAIDIAIISSTNLKFMLETILAETTSQLNIDAAAILLYNRSTQLLEFAAGRGFRTEAIRQTRVRLGTDYAGRAALERRIVIVPDPADPADQPLRLPLLSHEEFQTFHGVPLIAKGAVQGVLEIFHRSPFKSDDEWLEQLDALAGQTAIAIDNASLFEGLQHSNTQLTLAYNATIEGWSRALDLRDHETEGHTQRVTEMTMRLARAAGMSEAALVHIWRGSLLHDIGKMGVPDSILLKPGTLTDEEWAVMRKHPDYAYEMLSPIAYLQPALDIPYCHHEKWDGTGYPRRLRGEQIPVAARLFAVVDVWDALFSNRPYRAGWPIEKVREHIRSLAGTHFDPKAVELFERVLDEEGIGVPQAAVRN